VDKSQDLFGHQVAQTLLSKHESHYKKMLPYEKGLYHQCLPNPAVENEFITV